MLQFFLHWNKSTMLFFTTVTLHTPILFITFLTVTSADLKSQLSTNSKELERSGRCTCMARREISSQPNNFSVSDRPMNLRVNFSQLPRQFGGWCKHVSCDSLELVPRNVPLYAYTFVNYNHFSTPCITLSLAPETVVRKLPSKTVRRFREREKLRLFSFLLTVMAGQIVLDKQA